MPKLEDIKPGIRLNGVLRGPVTVVAVQQHGSDVVELTYKDEDGRTSSELLYRDREEHLEILDEARKWTFDADGQLFRLVSEAYRIKLAHLFDPHLAVHTSQLEALPHQITAVYGEMLPRQPLRFLLADDPGAGKTIMAGLFIKELLIRGDLKHCLIITPGSLVDQWQDELWQRFQLDFKIISNQSINDSKSGNPFLENPLVIARLDHLSRNEEIMAKLELTEWDLVVVDEAHKMSAHFFGNEVKETKRYKLGKLVGSPERTRHFLLMTATPHNGKEEDFQLFLGLLDNDRFEGKFRDGVHKGDTSDLMRRMVKEQLLKFDGSPLFPPRVAETVNYELSAGEQELYEAVTAYVREEMNRADKLRDAGEGRRGNRVGFALTILQRRLASSPEAIFQSLRRRKERLEKRVHEEQQLKHTSLTFSDLDRLPEFDDEDIEDLDDATSEEVEELEDEVVEQASTARTIEELKAEIETLKTLEAMADATRKSKTDKKWEQLSDLLLNADEMYDENGHRRKLIIFTEHRDTVTYITGRIRTILGRSEAVVVIQGGMSRDDRRKVQEEFRQDKRVEVLVATDAAGEGINLQRAHLMINYDLPWNPNRLEQRFGRIHRIGQTETCRMWSLVAHQTREGDVLERLLKKLEVEREALGGSVFDVLGKIFLGTELRKLLIEAIRFGDQPEKKKQLDDTVNTAMDHERLKKLIEEEALARDVMDKTRLEAIREDMERAEARRLQPHFIRSFFLEAFRNLGGTARPRETKRYEITHVPATIRSKERTIGIGHPLLTRYERICFEKELISLQGQPLAAFVCPGHPLLDSTIALILDRNRSLLKDGAILVDETDDGNTIRALFYLEHSIQDARLTSEGTRRAVSRQLQFVLLDPKGVSVTAGYAPYLDYRGATDEEKRKVLEETRTGWLNEDLEKTVISHAAREIVPHHLKEVRKDKEELIDKTIAAVRDRLTKEINYWDGRAVELKKQEAAGKVNARINSAKARQRADELHARLKRRVDELEKERQLSPSPPVVIGGALVVPIGFFKETEPGRKKKPDHVRDTTESERKAMDAVMKVEKDLGFDPKDVSSENIGYDIESRDPKSGHLRFIEVKGRIADADTVAITKNEILTALNKPENFILAVVLLDGDRAAPKYIRTPFTNEPDFAVTTVQFKINELLKDASDPN